MSSSVHHRRIASNLLFRPVGVVNNPLIETDADGRIVSVGSFDDADRLENVEFYSGILCAGLVNAHCHLELSYLEGAISEGSGFAGFARSMGAVRGRFTDRQRVAAIEAADAAMAAEGIAAVGDVANGESGFVVKCDSGIVYRTFAELFGLSTLSASHMEPMLCHPLTSLTPHSTYSVRDAVFRDICSSGDAPLSIHFMESSAESELFERRGDLWDWYCRMGFECDFLQYGSPARRIAASVPADRSVILVHNCCVTQQDIDIIMNHFTAPVYWCLCPRSNRYISRLEPPVELLRRNGLNICLGTDSLASNTSLSLVEEMKLLRDVPLGELLGWATAVGAEALGLGDRLGDVRCGTQPGLVVFSGLDYENMMLTVASEVRKIL